MVPESASVAVATGLVLAAVRVAVIAPSAAGVNPTVTLHVWPGPRLAAAQAFPVTANAAGPVSVTVSGPVTAPPELVSVNVCVAVCPGRTLP
jgi:hypothetical protein